MIAIVLLRVARIYNHERPLLFARTPEDLDSVLFLYHELWADFTERQDDFDRVVRTGNALGFAIPYARRHHDATPEKIAHHVVQEWKRLTAQLDIELQPTPTRPSAPRHCTEPANKVCL